MALTWKNVAAINQSNALGFMNSAGQDISNAFKQARNITDNYSQLNASNAELEAMANDPTITPEERTGLLHTAANQNISGKDKQALIKGLKAERGHKLEQDKWKFKKKRAGIEDNQWTRRQTEIEKQNNLTNTRADKKFNHTKEEAKLRKEQWQLDFDRQKQQWGDEQAQRAYEAEVGFELQERNNALERLRIKGNSGKAGSGNDDAARSFAIADAAKNYYETKDRNQLSIALARAGMKGAAHKSMLESITNRKTGANSLKGKVPEYIATGITHYRSTLNDDSDIAEFDRIYAIGRTAGLNGLGLRQMMQDVMDPSTGGIFHWDVLDDTTKVERKIKRYLDMEGKNEAITKSNDIWGNNGLERFTPKPTTPNIKNPHQRDLSRLRQKP